MSGGRKILSTSTNEHKHMPDYHVEISVKSDHHALQNLSSNPTAKVIESDNTSF
jgi:hypothetical protein